MVNAESPHVPVMPEETLRYLAPKDGGRYVDGTVGLGGHSSRILAAADCRVLGLDRDASALALAGEAPPEVGLGPALEGLEEALLKDALKLVGGVQSRAADLLGIKKNLMPYKLKKFNINPKAPD